MKQTKTLFLSTVLIFLLHNVYAQSPAENIRINQVGFFTKGIKKAVAIDFSESTFDVWKSDMSEKVYSGTMSKRPQWQASCEENVQIADFSNIRKEGNYIITIGSVKSFPFTISNTVLDTVAKSQMKYYYYSRCSYELKPEYAGIWARAAGHMNTAVTVLEDTSRTLSMPGGWYDAGDYGLYITTGSIAANQLMMSYEQFPEYWNKTQWNIPESGNDIPDILDEVRWELKWMYKMKDSDNGVWYKATSKHHAPFVMPEKDTNAFYCMVKNATSAYDYAATFALATRIFAPFNTQFPGYADSCITAAKEAWNWALENEATHPSCSNPEGIHTGGYNDDVANYDNDNKVYAGVELFITTGDSTYLKPILDIARFQGFKRGEIDWIDKRPLASIQLALHGDKMAQSTVIAYANSQLQFQDTSAYLVNIGNTSNDFDWGSNRCISNRAVAIMAAYILTREEKYMHGVVNTMDYVLGRNATGFCFITGLGSKRVMNPHHRASFTDGIPDPVPGLPIQGPFDPARGGLGGRCVPKMVSPCAAKNFYDHDCSYVTNELTIDQGSPHIFNLGGLLYFLGNNN